MSLLDTIKADQLAARKRGDKIAGPLLTTLIGESSKISDEEYKKGITTVTDEKVIATLKKFLKNAEEVASLTGRDIDKNEVALCEIEILSQYLPQQMDEAQLRDVIDRFKAENADANMGSIMAYLKANYAGLYDGKMASQVAKG